MAQKIVKSVVTLGELMLRLKSPGFERLLQSPILEAAFGGSESNVAISCANFGIPTKFVSAIPNNLIGDAAIRYLKSFDLDIRSVVRKGSRLGIYYFETGSGPRGSTVLYDRANASINELKASELDWKSIFSDAGWFHISGITPALSQSAADLTKEAMQAAKSAGVKVSFDLNFRKKLWNYGKKAPEVMNSLMAFTDVVVANEEDIQESLGLKIDQKIGGGSLDSTKYESLAKQVFDKYPSVQVITITLRESFSADNNGWSALCMARDEPKAILSRKYSLTDIVDRVGGGDSFVAGLIYGKMTDLTNQMALEFAVAASALKHTIPGDTNRVSVSEVLQLLKGDASGRVQR
jgi:2-dehydro-3-deoxygluconokinase